MIKLFRRIIYKIFKEVKLKIVIIFIGTPVALFSQSINKLMVSDSVINVKSILIEELGQEMKERIKDTEAFNGNFTYAYLELENTLRDELEGEKRANKIPGGCNCFKREDTIYISNFIGLMAGLNNLIQINFDDSTYTSKLIYQTDGEKSHKLTEAGEFVENIELEIKNSSLLIAADSEFEHNKRIAGKFIGTTVKYYEQDNSPKGFKEVQTKVLSIFECNLEDYNQRLLEMEPMNK